MLPAVCAVDSACYRFEKWRDPEPEGLSILAFDAKLLLTMPNASATPTRVAVPAGPRHNELRSVAIGPEGAWYAGHEDGPLTRSGDSDPSQIRSTGVVDVATVAP